MNFIPLRKSVPDVMSLARKSFRNRSLKVILFGLLKRQRSKVRRTLRYFHYLISALNLGGARFIRSREVVRQR